MISLPSIGASPLQPCTMPRRMSSYSRRERTGCSTGIHPYDILSSPGHIRVKGSSDVFARAFPIRFLCWLVGHGPPENIERVIVHSRRPCHMEVDDFSCNASIAFANEYPERFAARDGSSFVPFDPPPCCAIHVEWPRDCYVVGCSTTE